MSLTPVANNRNTIRLFTPESELEEKCYVYFNSTTQGKRGLGYPKWSAGYPKAEFLVILCT